MNSIGKFFYIVVAHCSSFKFRETIQHISHVDSLWVSPQKRSQMRFWLAIQPVPGSIHIWIVGVLYQSNNSSRVICPNPIKGDQIPI